MKKLSNYPGWEYLIYWLKNGEDNFAKQLYRFFIFNYIKVMFKGLIYMSKHIHKSNMKGKRK